MRPSALAIFTVVILATTAPAAAGITAVFGGLRPAVSAAADAVCATPADGLLRLEPIADLAASPLR